MKKEKLMFDQTIHLNGNGFNLSIWQEKVSEKGEEDYYISTIVVDVLHLGPYLNILKYFYSESNGMEDAMNWMLEFDVDEYIKKLKKNNRRFTKWYDNWCKTEPINDPNELYDCVCQASYYNADVIFTGDVDKIKEKAWNLCKKHKWATLKQFDRAFYEYYINK